MGVAYYIVTKRKVKGLDTFVNGKAVAHASAKGIEKLCKELGVAQLTGFLSQSPEEIADFIEGEGFDAIDNLPKEQWFQPEEGLATVRALIKHLEMNPKALRSSKDVVSDLKEYELVLEALRKNKVQWHLALDF